jgi:hypothetical protein
VYPEAAIKASFSPKLWELRVEIANNVSSVFESVCALGSEVMSRGTLSNLSLISSKRSPMKKEAPLKR